MSGTNLFSGARNFVVSGIINAAKNININNYYFSKPPSDAVVPLTPNPSNRFTGRTETIAKLKEHFSTNTKRRKYFLLHGMGGIGKTQICLKFIEEMSDHFSIVFWIDASSAGTITQGLKGICNLPEAQSCALDGSPESALKWIGSLKDNYAMVFDNADVLSPSELEAYFPPGQGGNILITSRNSTMQCLTLRENSLEVREMDEMDAIELLLKASCLEPSGMDQAEASKIVKELFCLPLAVDQAGAFIASGATSIRGYLAKYSQHREKLLSHSEFKGASKYNRTVYGTWELSYKEIQHRGKSDDPDKAKAANNALFLLGLFSFFHHEDITEEIFSYAAIQKEQKISRPGLPLASSILDCRLLPFDETGAWDNFIFREGLQILLSFCLVKQGPCEGMYSMHPLVHAWGRDRMTSDERQKHCLMAYVTMSCSLRYDESQPYGFRRALVTHVRANMQNWTMEKHQTSGWYFDDADEKTSLLLKEQGYPSEAEKLDIQVLDVRNRSLGVDHPDAIRAMANLASTYENLGKYIEAESLNIQVLDARNRVLGLEHPDTILAMANLAVTCANLGKHIEAEKLQIQVLDARNRTLGREHPDTLMTIANLATTCQNLGKCIEGERLHVSILDAMNRILGVDHPETIRAMANLAAAYEKLGKYTEAEKMEIQVLDTRSRILGVRHPDTIMAMANLAATYKSLGKYTDAEKLQIKVLDARNRILGVEHPHTIQAMVNLAAIYQYLGKYTEAEKLQIQVLDARNKTIGLEHPDTIMAMSHLAVTYSGLQKYREAEKLGIKVLDARNRILGVEHPDTIEAMENLAVTCSNLGQYAEGAKLMKQVLNARVRVLGEEHPDTITAMGNLAAACANLGQYIEAEKLQIQVVDARNKIFGVKHPDTIMAMEILGTIRVLLDKAVNT